MMEKRSVAEVERKQKKKKRGLEIEGYPVEGLSIGGQETCVIFPSLKLAFNIGRCPQRAISQDFLFISHAHLDHIGGLPMYVATRGLYNMKPPTIFVPAAIKENVEKLFEVHRAMDQSELKHKLIALNVGEEYQLRKDLKVKAFKTFHVIPSQGYIIYSVKQKFKQEYIGLSGNEIKSLKQSGVEITYNVTSPEIAFTGDTMYDFILDPDNADVLRAKILVVEIHTKRHNRLEQKRLNDLVYICYNQILHHRYEKRDNIDPISLKDIDESNEWLTGMMDLLDLDEGGGDTSAQDLVFEDEDLDWKVVSKAMGVDEPQAKTRAKGKTRASNVY